MCIVFSIIERVYWYLMVILSSMFVVESSYVSFLRSYFLCIHFVIFIWEWDEWPSLRNSRSFSFPSLHSLLMWLHFMFDLGRSPPFFTYSLFRCHFFFVACDSSRSLHVLFSSYSNPSRVRYSLRIIITHITISSFCFICLLIDIIFMLGILKSMTHGIHYTCCISYMRAWVFYHWVFEPSFPSFLSPYHPITLAYVTSRVLRRPWGHGIKCRFRQPLLGQVFEIWLIFRYRHASSSGSRLFDV